MTTKRAVRSLKPTHLVALRSLDCSPTCLQVTAPSWPRVAEGDAGLPFWTLLTQAVTHHAGRRRTWVYIGSSSIEGLAIARLRCGGLVWDVRYVWAERAQDEIVQALLTRVCEDGAQRGARRVFLELPLDDPSLTAACRAGFQEYTQATLLVQEGGPRAGAEPWLPRARQRGDETALFQLYKAAVPAPVRAAEAMTLEEWAALHKGVRRWSPGQLGDHLQLVWEGADGLVAWAEVIGNGKSQHLEWQVHPDHVLDYDALAAGALARLAGRQSVWATSRAYQQPLQSALERAGFLPVAQSAVLVNQLAVRVPERVLVAAPVRSIAGG